MATMNVLRLGHRACNVAIVAGPGVKVRHEDARRPGFRPCR